MSVTRISPWIYNNIRLFQLTQTTEESLCTHKASLFKPVLLAVTKPCLCGRMWEDGMVRLVLLKKEPERRVFAVSRAAIRGKRLTFRLHLISLSPHALPHISWNYSIWCFCWCSIYVPTFICTLIITYIHSYIQSHTHTAFHFSICIKGVRNGEVAPFCPHISFLRVRDAHPSNFTWDVLGSCWADLILLL